MKILFLTFYFEPDLCAGSFRNSPLANELSKRLGSDEELHVVTTMPNRYTSFKEEAQKYEERGNMKIQRITIPNHRSGFFDQINSFKTYFFSALRLTRENKYDLVYASSSRLFTAFLGRYLANKSNTPLYLDIRDIFTDTMNEVIQNRLIKTFTLPVLKIIENYTFKNADHINLVSEGFKEYFSKYSLPEYTYYTNGIDEDFMDLPSSIKNTTGQYTITYAGNIGEGQGLHKIIPKAAKELGSQYKFVIIGDGGAREKLIREMENLENTNVEIVDPVNRSVLKEYYAKSDFLFLHLNDFKAFEKVLPSKVFEYGAYDKPVIAGVAGYAHKFIERNIDNHILFMPGDSEVLVNKLKSYQFKLQNRTLFITNFNRGTILNRMAGSILNLK